MLTLLEAVRLDNAVVLPTALAKLILPVPAETVSAWVPLMVELKVILLLVVVKVVSAPKVTASPKDWIPLVVMLLPLIAVVPPASVVKLAALTVPPKVVVPVLFNAIAVSALVAPTLPVKVILPVPAETVSAWVPSIVEPKLTAPLPLELSMVVSAPSETAPV